MPGLEGPALSPSCTEPEVTILHKNRCGSILTRTIDSDPNMGDLRAALDDLVVYVLVPFAISTLAFVFLIWQRDPGEFGGKWPFAFVASGVIGIFAFVGFVGRRSRIRLGIWRDLI